LSTTLKQHGSINHVAIAVSDLAAAMAFFRPFLEFFGFTVHGPMPYADTLLTVNVNDSNGIGINIWEAKEPHPFRVYEPGLHHLAINAGSPEQVDEAHELVRQHGFEVLDGPGEFPFAEGGYYAFYFLGPDDLKFEVVHMPELD
jgi:catechol 2,3-dioxygenase-like lactoylglutathione lyase family enzyme